MEPQTLNKFRTYDIHPDFSLKELSSRLSANKNDEFRVPDYIMSKFMTFTSGRGSYSTLPRAKLSLFITISRLLTR